MILPTLQGPIFVTEETDVSNINAVLQQFWEIGSSAIEGSSLSCENKRILECTENTIQLVDGRYTVSIPWKSDKIVLPNNYSMALRRLQNLEKTLVKNPEIAKSYQKTICN